MPQTIHIEQGTQADRQDAEQAVFGGLLTERDYGDMAGDLLGDGFVRVWYNNFWAFKNLNIRIKIRMENSLGSVTVRLNPGLFDLSECVIHESKRGRKLSGIILYRIAQTAQSRGFTDIQAVGEKQLIPGSAELMSWGYKVFPKLGFDAPIPPASPERPPGLAGHSRLLELLQDEVGRDWWDANGVQVPAMEFDLTDGSRSWLTLMDRV